MPLGEAVFAETLGTLIRLQKITMQALKSLTEVTVAARVPKELSRLITQISEEERVDRSTIVRKLLDIGAKEWRVKTALDKYQRGTVTLLKAASIAGLTIYEMIDVLEERGIAYRYDISDLEEHVKQRYG